jgi:hypothetical protein
MKIQLHLSILISIMMVFILFTDVLHAQTWEPTNGPYGGSTTCLATNDNVLFAGTGVGTYGNGVFKSLDYGATWSVISALPTLKSLASTGSTLIASSNGIYQSTDNGSSWISSNYSSALYAPNVIITDGTTAFAGGFSGFYVSEDDGLTWTSRNDNNFPGISLPNLPDIKAMAFCDPYLYAGTGQKGIFRSLDNGLTWEAVNSGLGYISSRTFGSFAVIGTDIFVGTMGQGVFRLVNNGNTWTSENNGLPTGAAQRILTMIIKDNDIYAGTNAGLYRSNNTGTINWTQTGGNMTGQQFRHLLLVDSDIYSGISNKGIYVSSDNSNTWVSVNQGITGVSTRNLTHGLNSDILASTYEGAIYTSSDEGATWVIGNISADAGPCLHGTSLFVGTEGTCYRSTDYGITWNALSGFSNVIWGAAYTFLSKGDTLFAGCGAEYGVYYSTDNGDSWSVTSGIWNLNPWGGYPGVLSLLENGSTMYAGTVNGVFKSSDNGLNWVTCYPAMANIPISSFAVSGDYIFAGTANYFEDPNLTPLGIYRSGDNGTTWTPVNTGLGSMDVFSLTVNGTDLFAGTASGIFKSTNNGDSWFPFNDGYPNPPFAKSLLVEGNYLYSGNFLVGQPVYRLALSGNTPDLPGAINGNATPCIGSSQNYNVDNVSGVTYTWQFPSDWVITNGQGTNEVTVITGSMTGNIIVTPSNGWGDGPTQAMAVVPSVFGPNQPVFDPIEALCQFSTAPDLPATSNNGITGTWDPNTINTDLIGSFEYVFTPDSGQCASIDTMNITINEQLIPEFDITNSVCQYFTPPILPITSLNGITGTWNPDVINTNIPGTFSYTFTPDPDQCASVFNLEIVVESFPLVAGSILGDSSVCQGAQGIIYSVDPIGEATSYTWTVPANSTIVAGNGTTSVTVDFSNNTISGQVSVSGVNSCGTGSAAFLDVAVNPLPDTPVITQNADILTSSAPVGNQWFLNGTAIPGATEQTYQVIEDGDYSVMVTLNDCSSEMSDTIHVVIIGIENHNLLTTFDIYPNPNHGNFTISMSSQKREVLYLSIQNSLGLTIYKHVEPISVDGNRNLLIDLPQTPKGFYVIILQNTNQVIKRKIVIN